MTNLPTGCNPVGPLDEDAIMAKLKPWTKDETVLSGVTMDLQTEQVLTIDEICSALTLHLDGTFHSFQHRYAGELNHQQVVLETFHETKEGKKFRVVTQYDESLTIVDLVNATVVH